MASVDDRIVRMEFDNAAFERKIDATIASLAKLEKSLKFDGAKQGFSDISNAAGRFNLGNVGAVIEGASSKFLAFSTIAITALSQITSKAISTASNLVKAFSFDPVIAGAKEYETNLNSIQTILANTASKGTTMDQVTAALDKLNQYSDQTIYNFGQMAKNIGTFTAAGVDLNTSVASIKGIANLAAMSGSSAEQASNAMYQLSQAIATGSLKLIDWNSVVNAGMGGEAFKSALFETGKAMKTITGVPLKTTFKEWEDAGNSFRGSLENEWITAEVLTTTLEGFTGDLTEEMLIAKGFSQLQATNIAKTAAIARAAATEVKTFSQLMGTVKEAVGTGWADSFKIVIGNFTEAKALWTDVNNSIGSFVSKSADARNELLQGWKDLGGRALLISALKEAFRNLGEVLAPIKKAFRDIFPKTTAKQLMALTQGFYAFAAAIKPSEKTVKNIGRIFRGFFAVIEIGWTILKEGVKIIRDVISEFTGLGSGGILEFLGNIGQFFTDLNRHLVMGEGIKRFFADLSETIKDAISFIIEFKDKMVEFFKNLNIGNLGDMGVAFDGVGDAFGRVGDRFESLKGAFSKAKEFFQPIKDALDEVIKWLDKAWDAIHDWFAELGQNIADVMGEGDFNAALDAINVALLGGIAALLAKFIKDGFNFDIGSGFLDKIGQSFEELTGVLKAMQTDIKANALLKIAGAIALLTASVLVLSMIDSAALTKALTAMAIGFGQLMATFAILSKISMGPTGAASFGLIAAGMILLSGALVILSGAVAILANLSWDELARGLTGVTVLLGVITGAVILLSKNAKGMILVGIGMLAIATAINILAGAVAIFATMDWGEMAKGFAGVAVGLLIIAGAMQLMPLSMVITGIGLLAVAVALNILAGALKIFATMSWEEMGKGMVAIAGGLLIIAGAMHLMPLTLPITAAGLILVGIALNTIAGAMKIFATMSWEEIGRGLAVMAGALLILAVATNAMSGALVGAIAITVVSAALLLLTQVLKAMASISWGDLIKGLVGIAAIFAVLGVAALLLQPVLPALLLLGVALALIGAGFALFGIGAQAVAKAFEMLAKSGAAGAEALGEALKAIGKAIPAFTTGLAEGIIELALILTKAAPVFAKLVIEILSHLIKGLDKLIPEIAKVVSTLITELVNLIKTKYPEIVLAGIDLILSLLQGIRDRIGDVVTVVSEIIQEFLNALTEEIPKIATSVANLITTMWTTVANTVGKVAGTLLFGIGIAFLQGFMDGIFSAESGPMKWFKDLASKVLSWIGEVFKTLWSKGTDLIGGFIGGYLEKAKEITTFFTGLAAKIIGWLTTTTKTLFSKGWDLILGFWEGVRQQWTNVTNWFGGLVKKITDSIPNPLKILYDIGRKVLEGLWNGMKDVWGEVTGWLSNLNPASWFNDINLKKGHADKNLIPTGKAVMQGLQNGMEDEWDRVAKWLSTLDPSDSLVTTINGAISGMVDQLETMGEFNPVITPVLDLTRVTRDAKQFSDSIQSPTYSYAQARGIASTTNAQLVEASADPAMVGGVRFEQNIYAPTQLSTSDIYKQTRNQITMAKEELSIP